MAFTVVPIHNLNLLSGTTIPYGKFNVQNVPDWLLKDSILKTLSERDRQSVQLAKHALISEYEAYSYGHPDPEWTGQQPKGIQNLRWQSALLANMCMWMVWPSTVCITVGFHAMTRLDGHPEPLDPPFVQATERETNLFCHERDFHNVVEPKHVVTAAKLFEALSKVQRKNAVWPALRAFWGALTAYPGDMRYPLFWQGLESLFGSDTDNRGVTKRLCDRISYFLADDVIAQKKVEGQVRACYAKRSDIVHGRWEDSEEFHKAHMYDTGCIVRTVVRHIATKPGMLGAFLSPKRNDFLEAWVKSKAFIPPPLPT
jgi:Apea-like HEPN